LAELGHLIGQGERVIDGALTARTALATMTSGDSSSSGSAPRSRIPGFEQGLHDFAEVAIGLAESFRHAIHQASGRLVSYEARG